MIWTSEAVAELERLWPTTTASEIAQILGTTKGSVIGKAHRLKLPPKAPSPSNKRAKPKIVPAKIPAGKVPYIEAVQRNLCLFPADMSLKAKLVAVCGKERKPGKAYCPECHARTVRKVWETPWYERRR